MAKILKHTVEGIAIICEDKGIEYVNDRACEILSKTRDEILGQPLLKFIHPDSSNIGDIQYTSKPNGKPISSTYKGKVVRENDEARNVQIRTTILANGENEGKLLAQILDVTEERRTQDSLSEYVMKYSTLIETMNEGVGVIDDTGVLIHANIALCKMLDYSTKELVGMSTENIMYGFTLDEAFEKIKERIAGKPSRYETLLVHKSRRMIPVMVSASPLLNDEGEYKGSFAIFSDITTQKKLKKELQAVRNRALLYLDLMSHDIRNNLQEIQIASELLKYRIVDSSSQEYLNRILHAVSRSSNIISETNIIEELAELSFCEKILDETLTETVMAAIIHFDDVEFNMTIQVSDARILADDYLELMLSDLLSNACEQCYKDEKRVWISLVEHDDKYELTVSDNGPGIDDNDRNHPSDTSRFSGGLRFELARLIVEKYSGTIEVLNRVEGNIVQGSKIRVLLPKIM
jgi:PAS domain S-box-containing protein